MKNLNKFSIFKYFNLASIVSVMVISVIMWGCSDTVTDPINGSGTTTSTTVAGVVVNENRQPVAGATVTVNGNTTQTGSSGEFMFNNITVPAERFFVNVTSSGYFNASRAEIPNSGDITQIRITMLQKTVTHTITSATGGSADLSNGSKVEIQPNSVVTQNGSQYNGSINMSVAYMDPTSNTFAETVQGGDMAAMRSDSSSVTLYSYGILKVVMEGSAGEQLQLAAGSSSTITTSIPPTMVGSAPSTIPLWFYDENTGLWREEGTATKQGDKYVGTVAHFTDWNCDYPGSRGTVRGRVLDCNGLPMPGITIKVGQGTTLTDASGNYERNVPAGISFNVSVEASQNFGISAGPITVDPLAAGNTVDLPNFNVGCYPIITGIFKNCDGTPAYGTVNAKWDNQLQVSVTNTSTGFRMTVAPNKTATIRFIAAGGTVKDTTIQTPSTATTLDLGTILMCGSVSLGENSFVINGAGFNNQYVNLNPQAAIGIYFPANLETSISAVGQPGEYIAVFFPGNTTGSFTAQNGNISYQGINFYASKTFNVNVTTYEAVGGLIAGTFEGSVESSQGPAQITNGKFFVIRQPDQN